MDSKIIWETLSKIDVNNHCDKRGKFTYLSWSWAWATLMNHYPGSYYDFEPPIFFDDGSCEIWVTMNVLGVKHSMWLPVMDYNNKAVFNPNSRDISDTRMRCLTKCMAMFGLGHYIYAGDSMPQTEPSKPKFTEELFKYQKEDITAEIATNGKTADQIIVYLEQTYTVGDGAKKAIRGIK